LWGALRGGRLHGIKFRRQHVIGRFVVDFCCAEARLVIEVDGLSHVGQAEVDHAREEFLRSEGYTVIRFTNDDLLQSKDAVLEAILRACGRSNA
jgi:very-short-patch-repair endonuclease